MKLLFEFDMDKKKIVFFGNGFEISSTAETYEDIAEFAKDVIENYIGIPNLKHRTNKDEKKIQPQIEAEWEIFTEVKNNTVCGYTDGRENYNFCPYCGKPMISGKKDKNMEEIKELEAKL